MLTWAPGRRSLHPTDPWEPSLPGQHGVQEDAQAPDVTRCVIALPLQDLGGDHDQVNTGSRTKATQAGCPMETASGQGGEEQGRAVPPQGIAGPLQRHSFMTKFKKHLAFYHSLSVSIGFELGASCLPGRFYG